ncbi:uncharacterized protein LOC130815626 [Amaranthus tricolor]|uniref:uncharacterized protein LOC130815626 n=1 Tax=Amaranthus tricolor TaxID=29722 RepID=UPI002588BF1C|nr:uncharacterized protein LOC130815626 [Amaranthus tricolor]
MSRPLFLRIVEDITNTDPFFQQRPNALRELGASPIQKCTAALRILVYGTSAYMVDEHVGKYRLHVLKMEELSKRMERAISRKSKHATIILEAVALGISSEVTYNVNRDTFNDVYYLTDGIYPKWKVFIPTILLPLNQKDALLTRCQESVRTDVERACGILQARFTIIQRSSLVWDKNIMWEIMLMLNMLQNHLRSHAIQHTKF